MLAALSSPMSATTFTVSVFRCFQHSSMLSYNCMQPLEQGCETDNHKAICDHTVSTFNAPNIVRPRRHQGRLHIGKDLSISAAFFYCFGR